MRLSFSGMKEFDNCARKYYQVRVLKAYPHEDSTATLYGKEVHLACEEYIRDGKDLGGHARFKPLLDKLSSYPGIKYTELEMSVDGKGQCLAFDDEGGTFRGIADLVIIHGNLARVIDYKTGKATYPEPKQLELMALMVFAKFPAVMIVKGALIFMLHDVLVKREYHRSEFNHILEQWMAKRDKIMSCADIGVWNPNPTGLCGYCPHTSCEHWKPKRKTYA